MDTSRVVLGHPCQIFSRFLIVAMPMVHPFVGEVVLAAQGGGDAVIDFQDVLLTKVETTSWALSFLQSEEFGLLTAHQGMLFEPLCPVDQVPIIRTGLPSDFHRGLVERIRVFSGVEGLLVSVSVCHVQTETETTLHLDGVPVPQPVFTPLGMSRLLPTGQLFERRVFAGAKGLGTHPSFIVIGPSPDDWVEGADDGFLRSSSQEMFNLLGMSLPGCLTGGDDRLEPKWVSFRVFSRVGLAHAVLSNRKTQEVKAHLALVRGESVRHPRFRWVQVQTHAA